MGADTNTILEYPKNRTDLLLGDLGFNLPEECREVLAIARLDPGTPVLDVGTGSGRMAGVLSDAGHTVYSGDVSCDAFLKLRDRLGDLGARRITFAPLDATCMPFPNGSFKAIVCANALHEMQEPKAVLSEMTRVCSRDGVLVVTDFNDKGFEVMAEVHRQLYGRDHTRGSIASDEISRDLSSCFSSVQHYGLALNNVWIASGKTVNTEHAETAHSTCFACGDRSPRGLRLVFRSIGKSWVSSECIVGDEYQGYPGFVQGGIVATLLDSAMTNCLFADGIEAMTVRLNVRYREPVLVNRGMTVAACMVRRRGRFYELKASIVQNGRQKATAEGRFIGDKAHRVVEVGDNC